VKTAMNPKLRDFDVVMPASLVEAVEAHGNGSEVEYLAGGSALLSTRYARKLEPTLLVNLKRIPELLELHTDNGVQLIGALRTIRSLVEDADLGHPALRQAAAALGTVQVRNLATVGGNVCNGSPGGDLSAPLMALDAVAVFANGKTERRVSAEHLWRGPGELTAARSEILTRLEVPVVERRSSAYQKFGLRRALELGVANAAVALTRDEAGVLIDARVAVSGVDLAPFRAHAAEQALLDAAQPFAERARAAGHAAAEQADPIEDFRASREFRRRILPAMVRRAAEQANETERT
jgi:carbon-monoxide dehydrogenase medium subunit